MNMCASKFVYKFIYREEDNTIRCWHDNSLFSTISTGQHRLSNKAILELVQNFLDEKNLVDVEYKVFVELH